MWIGKPKIVVALWISFDAYRPVKNHAGSVFEQRPGLAVYTRMRIKGCLVAPRALRRPSPIETCFD